MTNATPKSQQHSAPNAAATTVQVWDWPTRAFHWSLVTCVLATYPSYQFAERLGDATMKWHRYNGCAILILIFFRLIWGFVGSSTSRWLSFVKWPWDAAGYAFDLMRNRDRHFLGHNPLGTYMVLALLAAVALQSSIGLFIVEHNDTTWGPLYKLVSESTQKWLHKWHVWGFYYVILPLIGLHILANSLYGIVKKDPLIRAMITGKKPAGHYEDGNEAVIVSNVTTRAATTFAIAMAIVLGGIVVLGGKLFY